MIYLGSDHGGLTLKEQIKAYLSELNLAFEDVGAHTLDPNDDYPQFAFAVCQKVAEKPGDSGILFCRSASGMMIAANKVKHIRAVAVFDVKQAKHSRQHNNANVLGISGDWTDLETAKEIIQAFLNTTFTNAERHVRRLRQISQYEESI